MLLNQPHGQCLACIRTLRTPLVQSVRSMLGTTDPVQSKLKQADSADIASLCSASMWACQVEAILAKFWPAHLAFGIHAHFHGAAFEDSDPNTLRGGLLQVSEDHPTWNKDIFQGFCSQLLAAGWSLEKTILAQSQWRAAWGTSKRSGHED